MNTSSGQKTLTSAQYFITETLKKQGFKVQRVILDGRVRSSYKEVMAAMDIKPNTLLADYDIHQSVEALLNLTWVKSARVERHFPNTLVIKLTEKEPIAFWQNGNQTYLLDRSGDIIGKFPMAAFRDLIVTRGKGAQREVKSMLSIVSAYPKIFSKLNGATYISNRRWDLVLENDVRVKMPESYDVYEKRLKLLEDLLHKEQVALGNVTVIDLRHGDRLYLDVTKAKNEKIAASRKKQI